MVAPASDFDIQPRRSGPRRVKITREARTARLIFYLGPWVALLVVVGPWLVLNSGPAKREIASTLATQVAKRTRSSVRRMGGVKFGWAYRPCLQASEIYRVRGEFEVVAKVKSACVDRWPSAVGSGFRAVRVVLSAPSFKLVGNREVIAAAAPNKKNAGKKKKTTGKKGPAKLPPLREMEVVFDDLRLDWSEMPFPARIANGTFGPIDGSVTVQRRGKKSAMSIAIREPTTGMRMNGRAIPARDGWDLTGEVSGDLAPTFGPLLAASGLDIRKLPVTGEIGVFYSASRNRVTMDMDVHQYNVDIANRSISSERLQGFTAHQKARVNVDLTEQRVWVDDGLFEVNGIRGLFSFDVRLGDQKAPFLISAELKTVPMIKLLKSIPGTHFPEELKSLSPSALFALKFTMSGELKDPTTWQPKLENSVVGVGSNGEGSGLEYLQNEFTYYPLTKTGRTDQGRPAGPGSPSWTPYSRIPYVQRRAIQVNEDANFFVHNGIDIGEIQAALVAGLTSKARTRGGSTITQQLVKNLFLTRDRTAMRKIQEFFLTLLVESAMPKDKIFEMYANIIEWGPTIYGLREASYYYFARPPHRLTPKEMSYLASVIPGPLLFHKYYEQGWVPPKHLNKVDFTLKRLRKLDTIKSDGELQAALTQRIRFKKGTGLVPVVQPRPPPAPPGDSP